MARRLALVLGIISSVAVDGFGAAAAQRPQLVVIIVVDQLRGDYLSRLRPYFSPNGIGRLATDGAWFDHAYFRYGVLSTGPGHASIATGAPPAIHGVVGNDWYERSSGVEVYCCGDDTVSGVENDAGGRSPCRLLAPTLGDVIKADTAGRGQVWSVSLKDRSAILLGGKKADGAFWWNARTGKMVSSTYYGNQLPPAIEKLNDEKYVNRFFKTEWRLLQPADVYRPRPIDGSSDLAAYNRTHTGKFPKSLGGNSNEPDRRYYGDLYLSPMANDLVIEAAKRLITSRSLGQDEHVDLIALGLSANDIVGHRFGPESVEVMDCTLHTDRQLATFLNWLDEKVGLDKCIVGLSSDHGVGPIVEYAQGLGIGGGRFDSTGLAGSVENSLVRKFGEPKNGRYVKGFLVPWLYLDETVLRASSVSPDDAAAVAADAALAFEGVAATFTEKQITGEHFAESDALRRSIRNTYHPQRSGQVYIHWQRYWYKSTKVAGHGAAYDYDQHVPVMLMGAGIKPGRYASVVSPTSMAATICKLLNIEPAKTMTGEPLVDAIKSQSSAPKSQIGGGQ